MSLPTPILPEDDPYELRHLPLHREPPPPAELTAPDPYHPDPYA